MKVVQSGTKPDKNYLNKQLYSNHEKQTKGKYEKNKNTRTNNSSSILQVLGFLLVGFAIADFVLLGPALTLLASWEGFLVFANDFCFIGATLMSIGKDGDN